MIFSCCKDRPVSESCLLPEFETSEAAALALQLFGLRGSIKALAGERDLNFLIDSDDGRYVFKIANASEAAAMLECQHLVFEQLARQRVFSRVATPLQSLNGRQLETVQSRNGSQHLCRVLPYIEGDLFSSVETPGEVLLRDLGKTLGRLDRALVTFSHAALDRPILWNSCDALQTLARFKPLLAEQSQRELVEYFESGFRERLLPSQAGLRRGVIHNDANDNNVLIDQQHDRVISIIDFGDMLESWLAAEVAVAAAYAMLDQPDPLAVACAILRGYQQEMALEEVEVSLLFDLICMRLCMSVCICAYQRSLEPDNEYLAISEKPAWAMLQRLAEIDPAEAQARLRRACGWD